MKAINKYLQELGFKPVEDSFYEHIRDWNEWYKNDADDFHKTSFFNGISVVEKEMKRLGMAKTICETWANLLLNEKVEITTANDKSDKVLQDILQKNNFTVRGNQLVEISHALGTGAFVEYLENNEIKIDYITADMIYPLKWDSKHITDICFGNCVHIEQGDAIKLQLHTFENGMYVIRHKLIMEDGDTFKELLLNDGTPEEIRMGTAQPMFQIIKPNIVNNIDYNNPMGISTYANSIDILKEIDTTFDAINTEIETGRRMVFLNAEMFFTDKDGNLRNVIGNKESVMRFIGEGEEGKALIQDFTPTLRINEFKEALQQQLNLLSEKCGMGTNQFEFNQGSTKTATEIVSENSDLFQNLKKHELVLEQALIDMTKAISYLASLVKISIDVSEVSVNFDDSIIQDKDAVKNQAMLELNAGIIDNIQYYIDVYGMTEEQAVEFAEKIKARTPKEEPEQEEDEVGE